MAETSTKFVDLNSTRQISLNGGIRPADVVSSEEDVFSDATADVQAESTSRLSEDIHRIKVLEADFTLNDKMSTTVNHSIATVPAENHQDTPKLNNQPNAQKESPPRIEKCKHRKLTFTKYADFKLSSEEKQILLRWNPKEKTPGKKKRKTRGLDDKNGGNAEPSSAYTDDLPDGGQSEDRSIIEVESHANSSHRSFGPNSSGSESTSHDDSFSSVEWDPRIGAVLMKMHNQLQQINRKMCSLQDTLLIQQQMLNQLINDKNHPKVSWRRPCLIEIDDLYS
uniref:Uncharacterized protein n=1 Tax=Romanomermis culicivorax TaxID=13658 RepID=A0A915IUB8_ROMCU